MADVSIQQNNNVGCSCSPKPDPLDHDDHQLSIMEQGKSTSPSQDSSTIINPSSSSVFTTNAHKIIAEIVGTYVIVFIFYRVWMLDDEPDKQPLHNRRCSRMGLVCHGTSIHCITIGRLHSGSSNPYSDFPCHSTYRCYGHSICGSTTVNEAFAWEFILTFILMLTICGVATNSRAINELSGVTIGATVKFSVLIAGNVTGASMNPARSIGPALFAWNFRNLWLYILAPVLGTTTATLIYTLLWLPLPDQFD
ncbi:hypothetical protein Ddye_008797 [Dipteronia dyeriana]|uniref:Aquaporin n=1 Tax=Dipteronia dyeriana TaxID=168575 RepID=A0AAD9XAF4_9ROSI|nr:hypothetical protein Ddye_008797 [Dipteronia dyeriana]